MASEKIQRQDLTTDVLIIGGGTAGCLAATTIKEINPSLDVVIMEKANIERSGCLAAGMNAINAYLNPGETPESFTKYLRYDAMGLIREDLVLSAAKEINGVVKKVESWGLPIKKDEKGQYLPRGRWNIKINGESLKPIIAEAARRSGAKILNWVAATNYLIHEGKVAGAMGLGVRDGKFYTIRAQATIVATGGAAGIYKPNNDGPSHHKMWYPPFNTGGGYAMGIRAGAEMTNFEMRFIALRTKDIICPTGTLALGFGTPQVNARGERFMKTRYTHLGGEGAPTCLRTYGPVVEEKEGRGPCYMDTRHLSPDQVKDLKAAYLDMYPGIVLYWAANEFNPSQEPVLIAGTEPYVMGGHCQAGYWIDAGRRTTLEGLYAAGDVAGGYSYKFVSGCWAEGVIAGRTAVADIINKSLLPVSEKQVAKEIEQVYAPVRRRGNNQEGVTPKELEERLQKIMDEYAGGIGSYYELNEEKLLFARTALAKTQTQIPYLVADGWHDLNLALQAVDRLEVARVLVEHLLYRKETRWPGFQTRLDYPHRDDYNWLKFVNSKRDLSSGQILMSTRPYKQILAGDRYMPR